MKSQARPPLLRQVQGSQRVSLALRYKQEHKVADGSALLRLFSPKALLSSLLGSSLLSCRWLGTWPRSPASPEITPAPRLRRKLRPLPQNLHFSLTPPHEIPKSLFLAFFLSIITALFLIICRTFSKMAKFQKK